MISPDSYQLLHLLSMTSKKWTWYSLDRAMSRVGVGGRFNIPRVLASLVDAGLAIKVAGSSPSMPFYEITEKGSRLLGEHEQEKRVE